MQQKFNLFLKNNLKIKSYDKLFGLSNDTYLVHLENGQKFFYKNFLNYIDSFKDKRVENFMINNMKYYPKIYYQDNECRIEEYLEDYKSISLDYMIKNTKILEELAKHLVYIHNFDLNKWGFEINKKTNLDNILSEENNKNIKEKIENSNIEEERKNYCLNLLNELEKIRPTLKNYYEKYKNYDCLCHNDMNPNNILIKDDKFYLLDYEYSNMNNLFYEIGNFFLEVEISFISKPPYFEYLFDYDKNEDYYNIKKNFVEFYYNNSNIKDLKFEEFLEISHNFKAYANFYWLNILIYMQNYNSISSIDYKLFMGEIFKSLKLVVPNIEKKII